jgi:hypothetical protein
LTLSSDGCERHASGLAPRKRQLAIPKYSLALWKVKFPLRKDNQILEVSLLRRRADAVHLVEGLATIPADHYKQQLLRE